METATELPDRPDDADEKLIERHVSILMEHFDSVQVFATCVNEGGTKAIHTGKGNYYARRGIVDTWLTKEREGDRIELRSDDV
jgi:hypothetical protein